MGKVLTIFVAEHVQISDVFVVESYLSFELTALYAVNMAHAGWVESTTLGWPPLNARAPSFVYSLTATRRLV